MSLFVVSFHSLWFVVCLVTTISSSGVEGLDHVYPSNVTPGDGRTPLTLGLMLSFSGDYITKGAIPGIQLAVDIINGGSLLPGYRLQYSLTDSQVRLESVNI